MKGGVALLQRYWEQQQQFPEELAEIVQALLLVLILKCCRDIAMLATSPAYDEASSKQGGERSENLKGCGAATA